MRTTYLDYPLTFFIVHSKVSIKVQDLVGAVQSSQSNVVVFCNNTNALDTYNLSHRLHTTNIMNIADAINGHENRIVYSKCRVNSLPLLNPQLALT